MIGKDVYTAVLRQAVHDAVRAVLTAPVDSVAGSQALSGVTSWLAGTYGATAVTDLAEELAVDLAEVVAMRATVEGRPVLDVLDSWFHDVAAPAPEGERDEQVGTAGGAGAERPEAIGEGPGA